MQKKLQTILDETHIKCASNNCQTWNSIALAAMKKALIEQKISILQQIRSKIEERHYFLEGFNVISKKEILKDLEDIERANDYVDN